MANIQKISLSKIVDFVPDDNIGGGSVLLWIGFANPKSFLLEPLKTGSYEINPCLISQ
jgi:hypothetical protein